jgi:hypothetical protein
VNSLDFQENHETGDRQTNFQIYCWDAEDKGLDTVEGKETAHGIRAGDVGAPATPGVMAPTVRGGERERERKVLMSSPLVREGAPQVQDRDCQTVINIWS